MADRTSAEVYRGVFEALAENPDEHNKALARRFWKQSQGYDFSPSQMECDDALIALGLATRGVHPKYPRESEMVLYPGCGLPDLE